MKLPDNFIDQQREALLAEKARLRAEIKQLGKYPDYGDMADENDLELRDYENNKSIGDQMSTLLDKVNLALKAIDDGTYGQCAKCRKAIDSDRLTAMPYAEICVSCTPNEKK